MVDAYFRPEDGGITVAGEGALQAKVRSAVFLGDRTRLVLDCEHAPRLTIDVPGRASVEVGMPVGVTLREDALMLLD